MNKRVVEYHESGAVSSIRYYDEDGKWHREDGPAVEFFYENGDLMKQFWCSHGNFHKDDGPAIVVFHARNIVSTEHYFIMNEGNRKEGERDKPSTIRYYENGNIASEIFEEKGHLSNRLPLPSMIHYTIDGEVEALTYWNNDKSANPILIEAGAIDEMGIIINQELFDYYVGLL